MPENPLTTNAFITISLDQFLTLVFLLLVLFFMIHSAIVAYHWMTYGNNKSQAFLGTVTHIGVGFIILLIMGSIILF
jgi:hypothetical protein